VASITIARPGMAKLSGPLHPADLIDMAHSPAYFAAAGVADRAFSWNHASAAKIADPVIHGLIDRVQVGAPPTEDAARFRQGATVTIATHDGRRFSNTVFAPKGAAEFGIDWRDVMRNTARWCRWRGWAKARSKRAFPLSTVSGSSGIRQLWRGRCARASALRRFKRGRATCHCEERGNLHGRA
jgi:2-methylcitrate dehydratase PrpD